MHRRETKGEDETMPEQGKKSEGKRKDRAHRFSKTVRKAHKSFRTLDLLENPESAGNQLGDVLYHTALEVKRMTKVKKFFKWVWYNKEQLGSIAFSAILYAATIYLTVWGELGATVIAWFPDNWTAINIVRVAIAAVAFLLTVLTIRNTCVKYGLSSLKTIDAVLTERAEAAAKRLPPEAKKEVKQALGVLKAQLQTLESRLYEITTEFNKVKCLHDAVASMVPDYAAKAAAFDKEKAQLDASIATLKAKIEELAGSLK